MMSQESIPSFVFHLVQMLSNWVTWFPYDFQVIVYYSIGLKKSTLKFWWQIAKSGYGGSLIRRAFRKTITVQHFLLYFV